MYSIFVKKVLDFFLSIFMILLTFPITLICGILLLFQNKGKVFFLQKRPGYKQRPFYIIKFKTMTDQKDQHGKLLPDMMRMTPLGKFIRKLSIDEIPQLINVIKGDMSLVGPRPLLFKYIPLYSDNQLKRHEVKPGITGWAQVNGRNGISWTKKFEHDVYYVENLSFLLDLKILWLTFTKVIKREGINQGQQKTMPAFNGEN